MSVEMLLLSSTSFSLECRRLVPQDALGNLYGLGLSQNCPEFQLFMLFEQNWHNFAWPVTSEEDWEASLMKHTKLTETVHIGDVCTLE